MEEKKDEDDEELIEIKSIILGESGVGKTNLAKAAIDLRFEPNSNSTVNSSYVSKKIYIFGKEYDLKLWDTAGQEKYRALTKLFYKNSKVVIFVYDITNRKSFNELEYWINEVKEALGNEPILGIVGNKSDLEELKEIEETEAKKYAEEKGIKFKLVSTKENPKEFKLFLRMLIKDYIVKTGKINMKENLDLKPERNENNGQSCVIF